MWTQHVERIRGRQAGLTAWAVGILSSLAVLNVSAVAATGSSGPGGQPSIAIRAAEQASQPRESIDISDFSVVEVRSTRRPNARGSTQSRDRSRQGGGIVIDEQGLILTIGYLVSEAEGIEVILRGERRVPASLIAHDSTTGLGLIRTAIPVEVPPIDFAESADADVTDPVLVVGFDGVAPAYIVSRREFAGSWEYLLDDALFTAPATTGWSGAALIDRDGKLLGVGSLLVTDAVGPSRPLPGNMFVPIDTLKPILKDLIATGKSAGPQRPWIGVNVEDMQGRVLVTRVSADGPADRSGLDKGDIILGVDGADTIGLADFYRQLWATGKAGTDIQLKVLKGSEIQEVSVKSMERSQYLRPQAIY